MPAIQWVAGGERVSRCPVCHVDGAKRHVLDSSFVIPGETAETRVALLRCAACGARYADPVIAVDYHDIDQHGLRYYVEQGAGIDVMLEVFSALDDRPVARYLEIGCSFGFAMDYARRMLGWQVLGFDPGFVAASGRRMLGLPIEPRLFDRGAAPQEGFDVVFCSEVIEHVPDPDAFVDTVRHALSADGVLLLTTPDGDAVTPDQPAELLIPILSPSQHVILYSAAAIETLLRRHGFVDVRPRRNATQLQVVAALTPLGAPALYFTRPRYRDFLQSELAAHGDDKLLAAGFGYRLLCEDVNAGAFATARPTYQRLRDVYRDAYGFDIERPATVAIPSPDGLSLAAFGNRLPYNLCGTWYCRGMLALLGDADLEAAAGYFGAAIRAGGVLRAVLQAAGTDDVSLANFCREAEIARLSAFARCDPAAGLDAMAALRERARQHPAPDVQAELLRAHRRFFTDLANLGHYAPAATLIAQGGPPVDDPRSPDTIPVAAAYGVYLLNHRRDPAAARDILAPAREAARSALARQPDDAALRDVLPEIELALLTASAFIGEADALRLIEDIAASRAGLDDAAGAAHLQRVRDRAAALFRDLGYAEPPAP